MTLLKICGLRGLRDLEACRGADYLGFVVRSDSPRCLPLERAAELMSVCDGTRVAVTTETRMEALRVIVRTLEPDVLQLHSPLDPGLLKEASELGVPVWGMLTVRPGVKVDAGEAGLLEALVLDSPGPRAGGNGRAHDWSLSRRLREEIVPLPVVLAGGIGPQNAREAVETVSPYALDVSSGVERAGGKDPLMVSELIRALKGEN